MRLCPICGGKMSPDEGGWFECNNDDHKYFCIRPDRKTYADRLASALDAARKQVAKLEAEIEFRDRSWESRESQAKRCNELEANYALLNDDYKQAELSNKTLRAENAKLKAESQRLTGGLYDPKTQVVVEKAKIEELEEKLTPTVLPNEPEPAPDREWTAEEREAAEHPRVGDKYEDEDGRGGPEITAIDGKKIRFMRHGQLATWDFAYDPWITYIGNFPRSHLVSRGPAPVQPKPLRDGDILLAAGDARLVKCYCVGICGAGVTHINPNGESVKGKTPAFNLYDALDHIKSGGRLLMVKDGEVGVALTKDEAKAIKEGYSEQYNAHRRSANAKIAAAMETEK